MKKILMLLPVVVIISAMLLSACGGSSQNASSSPSPTPTSTPSPTPTPQAAAHAGQSADQILQGLKAKGLPIGTVTTYTAANDPNHLLGRPGQYTDKVSFKDTRIGQGTGIGVSHGGSIEVFATVQDAQKRFTYLQSLSTSGNALFAEYEYLDGVVILRISSQLTPDQAAQYQTALKALP